MVKFLEWAEHEFDHLIIDTPPALIMSDAKLLAPVADGIIVTVGVGVSTIGMVRRCLRDMEQIGAAVIGVVLNGVRKTRGGYMERNMKMYYGYRSKEGTERSKYPHKHQTKAAATTSRSTVEAHAEDISTETDDVVLVPYETEQHEEATANFDPRV